MKQLPDLKQLSDPEKDSLIVELWQIIEQITTELENLQQKQSRTKKTSQNSSIPPSQEFKENKKDTEKKSSPRKASLGRKGGGRKLHPKPDQIIIAKVKNCPHCGINIAEKEQKLTALYEKIEIPPLKPIVTRIQRYGGNCHCCYQDYIAPVPVGMEQGSPFGDSIISLIIYF